MKKANNTQMGARTQSFRRSAVAQAVAVSSFAIALLWAPQQQAQVLQDAPPMLAIESALGSVIFARSVSNELELRRLSLQLLEAGEALPNGDGFQATGLKLAPPGTAPGSGSPFPPNADFFRLPGLLSSRTDSNGSLLAYCAFDLRGIASNGRAAGRIEPNGNVNGNSVSIAIISPGNNGRYEFRCDNLKNLQPGQSKVPSFPITAGGRDYDDVVYVLTHNEMTYAGTQRQNMGSSVQTYDNLTRLTSSLSGGSVAVNQVRWVRSLNQFFIATAANENGSVWQPLTPTLALSGVSENRGDFSWLSGAITMASSGAGFRPVAGLDLALKPGALTLGTQTLGKDGSTLNPDVLAAGIVLRDINDQFRSYVGLSDLNQSSFVIRHQANGAIAPVDRLRIAADGQVFLTGPTTMSGAFTAQTATFTGPVTAAAGLVATTGNFSSGIQATTGGFSGLLTAGAGIAATTGQFSGGISATTGSFSGLLTAGAGIEGTSGRFTGQLTANGAVLGSNLTLSPPRMGFNDTIGIYFADPDGGTAPASIVYRDVGTAGLEISPNLSVQGNLTALGILTANNGLNVNTAALNANAGLNVRQPATFSKGLRLSAPLNTAFVDNVIQGDAGAMHITSEFGLHVVLDNNNNNAGSDFAFTVGRGGYLTNGNSYVEMMRINALGNMGLGTSSPAARLDVVGTQAGTPLLRATGAAGQTADLLQLFAAGGATPLVRVDRNGTLFANAGLTTTTGAFTGGIQATTGAFSGGILATTGGFSGLLTAGAGIAATTGQFSDRLTANGGLLATSGRFSEGLIANGGLTASAATLTGALAANGGITTTNLGVTGLLTADGGLAATSGTFSGLLRANGGLEASTGTFSGALTANGGFTGTSARLSGLLTASGGIAATTGTFTGLLTANGGLSATSGNFSGDVDIAGSLRVRRNLTVNGDTSIGGNLTVAGRVLGLNVVNLRFFGYTGPGNSGPVQIGSGQFDLNTASYDFYLNQANENLYSIDQNLRRDGNPAFTGLTLGSSGLASSGNVTTTGQFIGYLNGKARMAEQVDKTLTLYFRKNDDESPYARADFDMRRNGNQEQVITVNSTPTINNGNFFSEGAFNNTDNRKVEAFIQNPHITYNVTCNINGTASPDCSAAKLNFTVTAQADKNTFLQGNNIVNQGSNNQVNVTENKTLYNVNLTQSGTGTISFAPEAGRFRSAAVLQVNGDFISPANVSLNGGETTTLTLNSTGLSHAKTMNQDVKTDSTVRFAQLTVANSGAFRHVQTETLEASRSASVRSLLQVLTAGGGNSIRLDGDNRSAAIGAVTVNGNDSSVTATRFIGTADRAVRLSQDLSFNFTGVISGSASTGNGFTYTINTALADNSIASSKLINVDGAKLVDGTVTTDKLSAAAVTTAKLANSAVITTKLADEAVSTSKLANSAVTTAKLADGAVTAGKIAAGAVGTLQLAPGATIDFARNLNSTSDIRLKSDIVRIDGATLLQRLSQTALYGFSYTREPGRGRQLGVLAQELAPLFPELVTVQGEGPDAGFLGVNYGAFSGVAAAGVGELNRKLDALGIRLTSADTIQATLPQFKVTRILGEQARFDRIETDEIQAKTARFDKLDAQQFVTDRSRSRQLQADMLNSGSAEGSGSGVGLILFSAVSDGHYLVQVSASDGSHATASVFVSGGMVSVVPVGGADISIAASGGTVYAIGPGKLMKASWLKTG